MQFLADGSRGWVVGENGLVRATADGGKSWTEQASGTQSDLFSVQFLADGLRGWAVGAIGTIRATADGGKSWTEQAGDLLSFLSSAQFLADGLRGWAVGDSGMIRATVDGGKSWTEQASGTESDLFSVQLLADGLRGWAVGRNGTIRATVDGGKSWTEQASGTQSDLFSGQFLDDGLRGWAVGDSGTIRATADGGKSWTEQASGTDNHLASVQFLADGLRGWAVGSNGTILRLETCDFSAISDAKTYQDYGAALLALSADAPDLRSHYDDAFLTIEKKIKEYVASIAEFKKEIQQLDRDNSQAKVQGLFDEREWFSFARSSVTRLGVVGFFVYFISLLSNLYRYMIRMAAFYNARADALMLMDPSKIGFDVLVDKLAPDALSFGKQGAGPMDHAFELAKTAVTALARK